MKQIKVFIAGSVVLSNEFNAAKSALVHVNNTYSGEIFISPYTFDDYTKPCSLEGEQEKYHFLIRKEADYVIFILDGDIGGISKGEFDVAWDCYTSQGRPGIYVYHKPTDTISKETQEVIDKVNACKQYYKPYTDLENLTLKIRLHFTNEVKRLLDNQPINPRIFEGRNSPSYKVRVNRPCRLLIDDKEVAILEEQNLTEIPLSIGVYLRKVVAIDDGSIFDEAEISVSDKPKLDVITLSTAGLDEAKRNALPHLPFQVDDLMYEVFDGDSGVIVSRYVDKEITEIQIPEEIIYANYKYEVKEIKNQAFDGCRNLVSVKLPQSITVIGAWAFSNCIALHSITIPNKVTTIGDWAFISCAELISINIPSSVEKIKKEIFYGCKSLISIIVDKDNHIYDSRNNCNAIIETSTNTLIAGCVGTKIPNVKKIGDHAFSSCGNLTSITIPNSVTSIGELAFSGCRNLTSITIPNSVKSIGSYAFSGCSSLTSITIPNSVISIGDDAFSDCRALETIIVDKKNKKYNSRDNCNAIIETSSNTLVVGCKNTIISPKVNHIGCGAFSGCNTITSISIPDSVKSIGYGAFSGCSSLTSITIPNSVKSIGGSAFSGCSSLTSIAIPNNVTRIGEFAFSGCSSLTSIAIPNSVISIEKKVFYECYSLISITIPDGVTSIEERTFYYCSSLTSIAIPYGVISIKHGVFDGCKGLISITIPNSVISIGCETFLGCRNLTSIDIPNSVTNIGAFAFCRCSSLTSITIPESVTSIGPCAFSRCEKLQKIYIPKGTKDRFAMMENLGEVKHLLVELE